MSDIRSAEGYPADPDLALLTKLVNSGRFAEAETPARKLLLRHSNHPFAQKALAASLIAQKRHAEALTLLQHAVIAFPRDAELFANLGIVLMEIGCFEEAVDSFKQAVSLAPGDPDHHANLGAAMTRLDRHDEAIELFRRVVSNKPDDYEAWLGLGKACIGRQNHIEAIPALVKAIELHPGDYYHEAVTNLGVALTNFRKYEEALLVYRQIHQARPDDDQALMQLIHCKLHLCHWQSLDVEITEFLRRLAGGALPAGAPFYLLAIPGMDARMVLRVTAAHAEVNHGLAGRPWPKFAAHPESTGRRRIGYLSADFREHATAHLMAGIFEHHDRSHFEVFAYSYGVDDDSPERKRLIEAIEVFRDLRDLTGAEIADRIRADDLDMLIDLKGWTTDAKMEISARRPAPVVVNWLGYPGSLGHGRLADYIIGDAIVTPLDHAGNYTETLALMPHSYQPNDDKRLIGPNPGRAALGLPEKGFVFCVFCQCYKINPAVFDIWCRLLAAVKGSVLWLLDPGEAATENLRREATSRGIATERLIFAPPVPLSAHLGRLQSANLALDTYPYGSHTTGSDALWAGVPLLAWRGDLFASRVSASLVTAAGVPELVADSAEQYHAIALRLATHPDELAQLRQQLQDRRSTCALFDTAGFTRDLERLYAAMIDDYEAAVRQTIVLSTEGRRQ